MKKIFINDLETEKRNALIKKNKKLLYLLCDDFKEMMMYQQEDASYNIMGKDWHKYVEGHDHYDSFFLTLTDWRAFYNNIDVDYLDDENRNIFYNLKEKISQLDALDCFDDNYYILEKEIEENCKILLKDVEDFLHSYEEIPEDDDIIQYADEMEQLNEYYIEEHEDGFCDGVIRRDVSYTETFI